MIEEALLCFDTILKNDKNNTEVLFQRSLIHQKKGDFGLAMNDLIEILEIEPDNVHAQTGLKFIRNIVEYRYMEKFNV